MKWNYNYNYYACLQHQSSSSYQVIKMSRFEDINDRMHNDAVMDDEFMNFIDTHFSELEIFLLQQGTMDLVWIWKAWFDVKNSSGEDERQVDQVLSQQIINTKKSFSRMHKSEKNAVLKNFQYLKSLCI